MIVFFNGRFSKRKQDMICQLVDFSQGHMFPADDDIQINFEAIRRKDGYCGDVMFEDDREFSIRLNQLMPLNKMALTVFHEMVHVSQYLKCMVMDTTSDYWDRWQEKEAHKKEKELMDLWLLNLQPTKTK